VTGVEYGLNIGRFISDHRGWRVQARFGGPGYTARRKGSNGRPSGKQHTAVTLDELHAKITDEENSGGCPADRSLEHSLGAAPSQ
jgi:hypothetical protein